MAVTIWTVGSDGDFKMAYSNTVAIRTIAAARPFWTEEKCLYPVGVGAILALLGNPVTKPVAAQATAEA